MLAVVDENDTVIGSERRDVIHRDGIRHRAVHIFALNPKGEIFLTEEVTTERQLSGIVGLQRGGTC